MTEHETFKTLYERDIYHTQQTIERLGTDHQKLLARAAEFQHEIRLLTDYIDLLQYRWAVYQYGHDLYIETNLINTDEFKQWQRDKHKALFESSELYLIGFSGEKLMVVNDVRFGSPRQCSDVPIEIIIRMLKNGENSTS